MKVILDRDMLVSVSSALAATEVGELPKGMGWERLRWDGERVVDLNSLSSVWVEQRGGSYVLHAVQVPGSQLVNMTYADRKKLMTVNGIILVKTGDDLLMEAKERAYIRIKAGFEFAAAHGSCDTGLGWPVDCRRSTTTNDVQNIEIFLRVLALQGAPDDFPIQGPEGENGVKGADNLWHPCTHAQLRDIVLPLMYEFGVELYRKKWTLEKAVDSASTVAVIDSILWT